MNQEVLEKYKSQSIHYFENALSSIQAGDAEKAGEFLWGSVAQALKAVAASKGVKLEHHAQIGDYAWKLKKELQDESIWDNYGHASHLHSNFYEGGLTVADVRRYVEGIRETIRKLLERVPERESD